MELLSEDDLNLKDMTWEELNRAWDLWFDLAQATNDFDPLYTHGVFQLNEIPPAGTPFEDEGWKSRGDGSGTRQTRLAPRVGDSQ